MIKKNNLVGDILEKYYTEEVKEQDKIIDDKELVDDEEKTEELPVEEKCIKKESKIQEAFFGSNYNINILKKNKRGE